jgi:hypothetical protein
MASADRHCHTLEHRLWVVRQCEQVWSFAVEHFADSALGLLWAAPIGGRTDAPGVRLSVEVIDIDEGACGEERIPEEPYGSFYATIFVAAGDRYGTRLVAIISGKVQERRMEADRVPRRSSTTLFRLS